MSIGIPRETKPQEYRVPLTPDAVSTLISKNLRVNVASDAGLKAGFNDEAYQAVGALVLPTNSDVYNNSTHIVKVKEPIESDLDALRVHHKLFCYLHLAANASLETRLNEIGCETYAFESVEDNGAYPLLKPMSEIAGRLSVQVGADSLHAWKGGRGTLLGGVTGTTRGHVVILGAGIAGYNAATVAANLGASVTVFDINSDALTRVAAIGPNVTGLFSSENAIARALVHADLVVGAVLIPNKKAPHLITRDMLGLLPPGAVLVDISVDQGGCIETTRPTTHKDPTFVVNGIVHYGVANMPGAVPATASEALSNAVLPYVEQFVGHKPSRLPLLGACNTRNGSTVIDLGK